MSFRVLSRARSHCGVSTTVCVKEMSARAANAPVRRSGAQREVLTLYRAWLREIRRKPRDRQAGMQAYVREQFDEGAAVKRIDVERIERLLRKGRRQLKHFRLSDEGFVVHKPNQK